MTTANWVTVGFLQTGGTASSAFHICPNFKIVMDGMTRLFQADNAICGAKPVKQWSWGRKGPHPTCGSCIRVRESQEAKEEHP